MLLVDGHAKICDFGLTKTYKSTERESACVGKFGYMSPECYKRDYDPKKNDVYCAGIMLFMMLVGAPPYSKLGDRAFRHLMSGERHIKFLLRQYKRMFLVPDSVIDLFARMFIKEAKRISIDEVINHSFWKKEMLIKYINSLYSLGSTYQMED